MATVALALAYVGAAALSPTLTFGGAEIPAIWLPNGLALAFLLRNGRQLWPGAALGAGLAAAFYFGVLSGAGPGIAVPMSLAAAVAVAVELRLGAMLLQRFAGGANFTTTPLDVFRFLTCSLVVASIPAGLGIACAALTGLVTGASAPAAWLGWWLADVAGLMLVTPLTLALARRSELAPHPERLVESVCLLIAGAVSAKLIFFPDTAFHAPLGTPVLYWIIAPVLWAGFRLGLREQTLLTAALATATIVATSRGSGPFAAADSAGGLLALQAFIIHIAAGALLVGGSMRQLRVYSYRLREANEILEQQVDERTATLKRSEERLELAVNGTSDGLWDWDLDSDELWCAPRFLELIGQAGSREASALRWKELLHPADCGETLAGFYEAIHGHRPFDFECRLGNAPDGERWFRVRASVQTDPQGKPIRAAGSIQDITATKHNEAALQEYVGRYRALFDNAPEAILVYDADIGRYVDCNQNAIDLFKRSRDTLLTSGPSDVSPEVQPDGSASADRMRTYLRQALSGATPVYTWQILDGEGRELTTEFRLVRLPAKTHRLIRASVIDITEQQQHKVAMAESEARYRTLMECAPEAILVVDADEEHIVDANENAVNLAGFSHTALTEKSLADLCPPAQPGHGDSRELLSQQLRKALTGASPVFEWLFRDARGHELPTEVRLARLPASGRRLIRVSITDISDRMRSERELRSSQERLARHLTQTPLAAVTWDRGLRVREWNPAAERIFGITREAAIGKTVSELGITGIDVATSPQNLERILASREAGHTTLECRHSNGRRILCEWYNNRLLDDAGDLIGVASFALDVTDREEAQRALKDSEERFRNLIEVSIEGICVHRNWQPLFSNQAFAHMLGFASAEQLIEFGSLWDLVPEHERNRLLGYLDARTKGGEAPQCYEFEATRRDGSLVTLQVLVKLVKWMGEDATMTTAIDVSERKRAEHALQQSERYLRQIIDLVPHMILSRNAAGEILLANRAVAEAYDLPLEQVIGARQVELHPDPVEAGRMLKQDQRVLRSGEPQYDREEMFTDHRDERRILEATRIPFRASDSDEPAVLEVAIDITEQKSAEDELRAHLRELEAVNRITAIGNQVEDIVQLVTGGLDVMLEFLQADSGAVYLEVPGGCFRRCACRNGAESIFDDLCGDDGHTDLLGPVLRGGEAVFVEELAQRQAKLAMLTGFVSLVALPVQTNRRVVAAVVLGTHEPRAFNRRDKNGLRMITKQLGSHLQRLQAEDALRASEERYRALYDDNPAMFFTVTREGKILSTNDFAAETLGYGKPQLIGRNLASLYEEGQQSLCMEQLQMLLEEPHQVHRWEACLAHHDGREIWATITARVMQANASDPTILMVVEDTSLAKSLSDKLHYHASHDALTGLINRNEFQKQLHQALVSSQRDQASHAVCYIDLDQFKVINDTCGHFAGDELLCQIGALLNDEIGKHDVVARLGGDEFGVLLKNCSLESARRVAQALRRSITTQRFEWSGKSFNLSASIGLVPIKDASRSAAEIMSLADTACFEAKDAGRNRVHVYREDDLVLANRHGEMQWVAEIHRALEHNRFALYYQPIAPLDPAAREGFHYELLVRMLDEDGHPVPPGLFLPAAERYSLSNRIDTWVVDAAFDWLSRHPAHTEQLEMCSLNLSGLSVGNPEFLEYLVDKCRAAGPLANKLCFEITETAAISNLGVATRFIKRLRQQGCKFALDDFGSGLSSFAYLKNLPVDYLKIDGVFIRELISDPIDQAAVRSINEIGHVMGKRTIAEFVENDAIIEKLREIGVDYAQGYGIAAPRPIAHLLTSETGAEQSA